MNSSLKMLSLSIIISLPILSYADYVAHVPLEFPNGGQLPAGSIVIGNNGNNNGGGNSDEPNDPGASPTDTPTLTQDGNGNSCAYNRGYNYVLVTTTTIDFINYELYDYKSTQFGVPYTKLPDGERTLTYNGKHYDLSWPAVEKVVNGNVTKDYYRICEKSSQSE